MPVTRGMLLIIYLNVVSHCMLLLAILCPRKFCLDFICGTNIGLGDKTRNVSALSTSPHTLITLSHKTSVWDRKGKSNFIFTIHTRKNLHYMQHLGEEFKICRPTIHEKWIETSTIGPPAHCRLIAAATALLSHLSDQIPHLHFQPVQRKITDANITFDFYFSSNSSQAQNVTIYDNLLDLLYSIYLIQS